MKLLPLFLTNVVLADSAEHDGYNQQTEIINAYLSDTARSDPERAVSKCNKDDLQAVTDGAG